VHQVRDDADADVESESERLHADRATALLEARVAFERILGGGDARAERALAPGTTRPGTRVLLRGQTEDGGEREADARLDAAREEVNAIGVGLGAKGERELDDGRRLKRRAPERAPLLGLGLGSI